MDELTERQKEVLAVIQRFLQAGLPFPSMRELAAELGVRSKAGINGHLNALARKGFITRRKQRVSDFLLTAEGYAAEEGIPLVGRIPAGVPAAVYDESHVQKLIFNQFFFGGGDLLALTITGESMAGDGIHDGDIAIIKLQKTCSEQDIVAVRVQADEVTLKRVRRQAQMVELLPSNPAFSPRQVAAESVDIIGRLVGLVRKV